MSNRVISRFEAIVDDERTPLARCKPIGATERCAGCLRNDERLGVSFQMPADRCERGPDHGFLSFFIPRDQEGRT